MVRTRTLPLVLAGALLGGCGSRAVILDHDGAIDDYVALAMLLSANDRTLRGVTISFGDSYPESAVEDTAHVLLTYGRQVPVGVFEPWQRGKNEFPAAWRAQSGSVAKLPAFSAARAAGRPESAVPLLRRLLAQKTDVLATGPLTNLAALLRENLELVSHIGRLVIMGGAVRVPGNTPDGLSEYNIFVDPEGADYVFSQARRGLRIELVPLDATNHLPVTREFIDRLLPRPAGQILNLATGPIYLWDGGAALALLKPELFRFETLRLKVTPEGRTVETPDGHGPIRVVMGLQPGAHPMDEVFRILQ
ncbi:MAG: nucleoside hydrolase [Acidobacteria bacterium]|nr:nucleoside hydrolase [Acidobacteriota bacterium]